MRIKFAFLILLLFLTGCTLPGAKTPTESGPTSALPTTAPTEVLTPTPGTPLAILVIPASMPRQQADLYQTTINDLAQASGLRFQVRNSLTIAEIELESNLKIVVAFPPDPGLTDLASAVPQVQFLGVTILGLTATANLSIVGGEGTPVDKQAFMAGYIAALLSPDFRVGIITQKDTPDGILAYDAFVNGVTFFCGLCNPQFPPWYEYPVHSEIPTDIPEGQYRFYADPLKDYMVEFAYVFPAVATEDLLDTMSQYGLNIISQARPSDRLEANWVVSIQPKVVPAIQAIWPDLVAGKGRQDLSLPLFLEDVNPDLLSEGKQNDVQQILDRLQRDEISTGVIP
ncbi:MAG: hypothetical protein A2X25_09825 [Chloroflexi bacterium GWB2_49_20]|nr:MAG: hypothetical protein A2X25_09825 [Chloroflexi bacterium GWB2_49_20]OGN79280.1 MAG: hypothetical protein A2X26_04200 [Chloroflexi bacterium GWC2_49_37]OGN82950.1 MAG: hypothetical protein A2X27_08495 [Chloroflexi bacterium GWD2_49_16]HCC78605.1 hypothetical protein [Anaerolineae bacterium]